jgi:hypothetical protein
VSDTQNPSTENVAANMGLGTRPGNSGVRVGVRLGDGTSEDWMIALEDNSGFIALEDGTGNILLEAAP